MRPLTALRKNLSLSSIGASFSQPPFWTVSGGLGGSLFGDREAIEHDFEGYVRGAFKSNGIVFTCILIRQHILSEARFQFQKLENGRPGDLHDDDGDLSLLENPWPNATTGELIARMEQDASLAGNFYATQVEDRIRRLRPDWVTIVTEVPNRSDGSPGSPYDLGAKPLGVFYTPPGQDKTFLPIEDVVHWSPIPDPVKQWMGMSWITAITREVKADNATNRHKLKFFENGATSNVVVTYDKEVSRDNVAAFAAQFAEQHAGVDKAYKTIHLGGGADAKMVGADLKQLDFKVTQGTGESRLAAASLVGAVMAQFSEGMQGSALNQGNFNAAKRRFADVGARPLWRSMAAALTKFAPPPDGSRLWYDDRDIPFLQDDAKDAAEILAANSKAIAALARDGFDPDSAVEAITSGDLRVLTHTGLPSVQVQSPVGKQMAAPVDVVKTLVDAGWTVVKE